MPVPVLFMYACSCMALFVHACSCMDSQAVCPCVCMHTAWHPTSGARCGCSRPCPSQTLRRSPPDTVQRNHGPQRAALPTWMLVLDALLARVLRGRYPTVWNEWALPLGCFGSCALLFLFLHIAARSHHRSRAEKEALRQEGVDACKCRARCSGKHCSWKTHSATVKDTTACTCPE